MTCVCVSYGVCSGVCTSPRRLEVATVLSENALSAPAYDEKTWIDNELGGKTYDVVYICAVRVKDKI